MLGALSVGSSIVIPSGSDDTGCDVCSDCVLVVSVLVLVEAEVADGADDGAEVADVLLVTVRVVPSGEVTVDVEPSAAGEGEGAANDATGSAVTSAARIKAIILFLIIYSFPP